MTLAKQVEAAERQRNAFANVIMQLSRADSALRAKSIDYMTHPAYAELRDAIQEARTVYMIEVAGWSREDLEALRCLNLGEPL